MYATEERSTRARLTGTTSPTAPPKSNEALLDLLSDLNATFQRRRATASRLM